jgi:hypothetical protein
MCYLLDINSVFFVQSAVSLLSLAKLLSGLVFLIKTAGEIIFRVTTNLPKERHFLAIPQKYDRLTLHSLAH